MCGDVLVERHILEIQIRRRQQGLVRGRAQRVDPVAGDGRGQQRARGRAAERAGLAAERLPFGARGGLIGSRDRAPARVRRQRPAQIEVRIRRGERGQKLERQRLDRLRRFPAQELGRERRAHDRGHAGLVCRGLRGRRIARAAGRHAGLREQGLPVGVLPACEVAVRLDRSCLRGAP